MPARERRSRQVSARSLFVAALVLPALCLLALWAVAIGLTAPRAADAHDFQSAEALFAGPARGLANAMAAERLQAVRWLNGGDQAALTPLRARFRATDAAVRAFLTAVGSDATAVPASAGPALAAAESALAARTGLRRSVIAGRLTPLAAVQAYSGILTAALNFDARLLLAGDSPLYPQAAAVVATARATELLNREVALAATAGAGATMSTPARLLFAAAAAGQRQLVGDGIRQLDRTLGAGYQRVAAAAAYRALAAAEDQVIAGATSDEVATAAARVLRGDQAAERQALAGLAALAGQASSRWLLAAVLAGGLGLIVVLLPIAVMAMCWWHLSRGLTTLRRTAAELSDDRLPRLADEVAQGTDVVTVAAICPAAERWRVREVVGTSQALAAMWQAAVAATTEQVRQRTGTGAFVQSVAQRSQGLLQRQLALLGRLGRDMTEPEARAGLAAVSALSTQLQRHASGLLVLAGDAPGQVCRGPLAIAEVLHAAAAELGEDMTASVVTQSDDAVAGSAAADVVHLVAELAEYRAAQTPPGGQITLRAGRVGRGLAIEVEDGGRELGESELEAANAALASPGPGFPADGQLSLHVAARLAARHRITVTVRPSPTGGTVAIALLPHAILATSTARDTIVDGLPRTDLSAPPAEPASPDASSPAEGSAGSVASDVPAGEQARGAASSAPWHWLTASQPAPPQAPADLPVPVPPGTETPAADGDGPAPLPRRVRPGHRAVEFSHSGRAPASAPPAGDRQDSATTDGPGQPES